MRDSSPNPKDLQAEAGSLQYLLAGYIDDANFLTANSSNSVLYFVDAHEINAFINPATEHLAGFTLLVERAHHVNSPEEFNSHIKLRNEQFLRRLLFDQGQQVGVLPSHEEEVAEEIAYQRQEWLREQVGLLDEARRELRKLQGEPTVKRLIAANAAGPPNDDLKRILVNFLTNAAPAVMALLRQNPQDKRSRIDALETRSRLRPIQTLDWESLGFDSSASSRLRGVRPSLVVANDWRNYLVSLRQRASTRANRIDGEAIAYLQALNAELAESDGPKVRARLVTRAMSLIHAVRSADKEKFGKTDVVRHPRLVTLRPDSSMKDGKGIAPLGDADADRALVVALTTYIQQLGTQIDAGKVSDADLQACSETLVRPWQEFEKARLAIELQAEADTDVPPSKELIAEEQFQNLLKWFGQDSSVIELIHSNLRRSIEDFQRDTFTLGQVSPLEPVRARTIKLDNPPRTRIVPMIAGGPGPIEFLAPALRNTDYLERDLEQLLSNLQTNPVERYLAWSMLFACQRRWRLANIYARSAIEIEKVVHQTDTRRAANEARLLVAQILRLGQIIESPEERYRISLKYLDTAEPSDARVLREKAAQILELRLQLNKDSVNLPSLAAGLSLVREALEIATNDKELLGRILELGLIFYLAATKRAALWPKITLRDWQIATDWHDQLHCILNEQRKDFDPNEISRRARAIELIGFQMFQGPGTNQQDSGTQVLERRPELIRIPVGLRLDVRELRDQLKLSSDSIGGLITDELEILAKRLERGRERDLVYAPVWSPEEVESVIKRIKDSGAQSLARNAYEALGRIAGGSQESDIASDDREEVMRIKGQFSRLSNLLTHAARSGDSDAQIALYNVRMEAAYTRLLLTRIDSASEVEANLRSLLTEYTVIAQEYPTASMPHFRLHLVHSELGQKEEEFSALTKAIQLIQADPFLQNPRHWVRSTMQRRIARRFSEEAMLQREKLRESPDDVQLRTSYLENLLAALQTVLSDESMPAGRTNFDALEVQRRVNNIVYYASLTYDVSRNFDALDKIGITKDRVLQYLEDLHPKGIDKVPGLYLAHTIGFAYHIFGEPSKAAQAGRRFLELLFHSGEDPKTEIVGALLGDAVIWIREGDSAGVPAEEIAGLEAD